MGRASTRKAERRAGRPRPEVAGILEAVEAYAETCETIFGPGCWDLMDARAKKGRGVEWPQWCPMPAGAVYAMAKSMRDTDFGERAVNNLTPALHATWLWRYGRGMYRFDDHLAAELLDTPLSSGLPVEVLTRLPEWSPLIVAPECEEWPREIAGAFVCHSWNAIKERRELRVIYIPNGPDTLLISIIPLNYPTLAEALEAWRVETIGDAPADGVDVAATEELLARSRQAVSRVIGLVLYLCAENAELRALDDPEKPIRQTSAPPVAQRPREVLVGYRTGPLLARQRASGTATGTGRGVEPHLRRAHWHHYWVGAADEGDRHLELRWINPTPVLGRPVRPRVRDVGAAQAD